MAVLRQHRRCGSHVGRLRLLGERGRPVDRGHRRNDRKPVDTLGPLVRRGREQKEKLVQSTSGKSNYLILFY